MSENQEIQKHIIPESELKKITDAVHQGIVMGKKSDSEFWGGQIEFNKRIEKKIDDHIDAHAIEAKSQKEFIKNIEPIIQKYNDVEGTKRTLLPVGKGVVFFGAILGGWEVIKMAIKNLFGIHN